MPCSTSSAGSAAPATTRNGGAHARSTSTCCSTVTSCWTSPVSTCRTRASTSAGSRSSRSPSWRRTPSCRGAGPPPSCFARWRRRRRRRARRRTPYTDGMSHLDELDEFEAELELQLKREYTAVFPLFRYCVLTQDATYLCNKLDLKVVPQASYPFFHAQMEDVWVWDKNRPTRIIPRAEVYTSGDVTVEELRGEGDEPRLTAEALAERLGDIRRSDDEDSF